MSAQRSKPDVHLPERLYLDDPFPALRGVADQPVFFWQDL